jgi:hypothetical protein
MTERKKTTDYVYLALLIVLVIAVIALLFPRSSAAQEAGPDVAPEGVRPARPMGRGEFLLRQAEAKRKADAANARAARAARAAKAAEAREAKAARTKARKGQP